MKILLSISSLLIALVVNIYAQDFNSAKMDSVMDVIEEYDKGMGSLSLFKGGKEIYQRSIGYANIDHDLKANAETKYRIGSISKTFTAVLIMQQVEKGKLKLDTKLKKFFPKIENANKITIRQMLQHRSGIYNFTDAEDFSSWMEKPITRKELVAIITESGSTFEPGTKMAYSNSGYVLLTYILEDITKKSYPELLKENIIEPCKLTNTYYGGKIEASRNEAQSYKMLSEWTQDTEWDMSIPLGAGGIVSTPTDLNKFFHHLFTGDLISKTSLAAMKKLEDNFGLGMFTFPYGNRTFYGHTGGIDGFRSMSGYYPEEELSYSYIANGVNIPTNDIAIATLSIYFKDPYSVPKYSKPVKLDDAQLDQYLGVYGAEGFPLKITITKQDGTLIAQVTGQPNFPLQSAGKHIFVFDAVGLKLEFNPAASTLILNQGGATYELLREKK